MKIDGGASLHDVPHWYSYDDFWLPGGTGYSDADMSLRKDDDLRVSPYNPNIKGLSLSVKTGVSDGRRVSPGCIEQ